MMNERQITNRGKVSKGVAKTEVTTNQLEIMFVTQTTFCVLGKK